MGSVDHLVVVARDLAQGVAWCEATLGVTPGPGGEHPLMGTHNRLLKIATAEHRTAYLEIIAINPIAVPSITAGARRWFDMDDPALQARVAQHGPALVHWVAGVPDIAAAVATLAGQGIDRGSVVQASRPTPAGVLQWQISVRADGQRLFDGCLPTLIEWGSTHPTQAMPDSGLALHSVRVQHPQAAALNAAYHALGLTCVTAETGAARLSVQLQTPKGLLVIHS
ncbi:MAG: VOC family protein [Pseudomonadota bacterium]